LIFAETSSVSETARRLGVKQPVVTKKLQVFKDAEACGAVLLGTSGGRPTLTDAAKAVLPSILELIGRYDRIMGYLNGQDAAPRVLRIGTGNFAVEHYLPQALATVRDMMEVCQVETQVCRGKERIVGTANGIYDISIVTYDKDQIVATLREKRLSEDSLMIGLLCRHPMCLVADLRTDAGRELNSLSSTKPVPIDRLTQWELIGPDRQSGIRRQLESRVGRDQLYFIAEGGGWVGAKEYARAGLGVAIVPRIAVSAADRKKLVCRRLSKQFLITDFLIHRNEPLNPFQQRVKDAIISAATHRAATT
jgi:DNA-binding transcriptional LysR family regulator